MKKKRKGFARRALKAAPLVIMLILIAVVMVSCGTDSTEVAQGAGDTVKMPPGTTEEMVEKTTYTGGSSTTGEDEVQEEETIAKETADPEASADLAGARFTVVAATRPDTNKDVITSGQREVEGDYLEVEMVIENVGDEIVDLSEYSFRIWNPAIDADGYYDYYGMVGTYGKCVSDNMISATLLDYATLQPVGYKLKIGESLNDTFLFFDLDPRNIARNEGVTKEGTNLVIHKLRGDDAGEEVEINLAGYTD